MADSAEQTEDDTATGVPDPPRRRFRPRCVAAAAVVLLAAATATVVVAQRDGSRPADDLLAAAQHQVSTAQSFTFALVETYEAGRPVAEQTTAEGEWTPKAWHSVTRLEGAFQTTEHVIDGGTAYDRWFELDQPRRGPWIRYPLVPLSRQAWIDHLGERGGDDLVALADVGAVDTAYRIYLGGEADVVRGDPSGGAAATDPQSFLDLVGQIQEPTITDRAGGRATLAATVEAPHELVDAFGGPVPDGALEVDIRADGTPTGLRLRLHQGAASTTVAVELDASLSGSERDAVLGSLRSRRDGEELLVAAAAVEQAPWPSGYALAR